MRPWRPDGGRRDLEKDGRKLTYSAGGLDGGLIQQLVKAGSERGLQAELAEHVGSERAPPEAALRNRATDRSRTAGTAAVEVELRIPPGPQPHVHAAVGADGKSAAVAARQDGLLALRLLDNRPIHRA